MSKKKAGSGRVMMACADYCEARYTKYKITNIKTVAIAMTVKNLFKSAFFLASILSFLFLLAIFKLIYEAKYKIEIKSSVSSAKKYTCN